MTVHNKILISLFHTIPAVRIHKIQRCFVYGSAKRLQTELDFEGVDVIRKRTGEAALKRDAWIHKTCSQCILNLS